MSQYAPEDAGASVIEGNLRALERCSPRLASRLRATSVREDVEFCDTADGVPSAVMSEWGPLGPGIGAATERALASRRRPLQEAERLAQCVDVSRRAAVVVMGFGMGYHVAAVARRMGKTGVVIVFEPDEALLRTVLENVDHHRWLAEANVVFLTDPQDEAGMAEAVAGIEHVLALGTEVLEHPPSRPRLGARAGEFLERFVGLVKAVRTTVVTTIAQSQATLRNLTQNLDHYTLGPGIAELAGACEGRPAIVVSAGPSLQRNIALLARPEVRERFVIIATQTTLRTLLLRGIRPHFVAALDFHEISRRFYEGLSAEDVKGVTLVVEPKVNPAVTSAFPGVVRCASDSFLDALLGERLQRPLGAITPGATVAHLCYYLARHLGCDPVILVGQDLGFSEGQYYSAGAAIHDVWSAELGEFNTLEMHEWERIIRSRGLLRKKTDVLGRPIYTDEQMATYLVQFQRDFKIDSDAGRRVIDATEGGVSKQFTEPMSLALALNIFGSTQGPSIDELLAECCRPDAMADEAARRKHRKAVRERVRTVREEVRLVGTASRQAAELLKEMLEHHDDQARVNNLIQRVDAIRDRVLKLQPAFGLVERLNQSGAYNRTRADRSLNLGEARSGLETQRRQIERDIENVASLERAAADMVELLDDALRSYDGAVKRTRDPVVSSPAAESTGCGADGAEVVVRPSVWAVVPLREGQNGLGRKGEPHGQFTGGRTVFQNTLLRLGRCQKLDGILVLCADEAAARAAAGPLSSCVPVLFERSETPLWHLDPAVLGTARQWGCASWRGGVAGLTCYDEVLEARAMADACERRGIDGALLVGADWCLVDPTLCDAVVERYREDPTGHRLTFTQAAPGLAGCVVDQKLLRQLDGTRATAGIHATIGGLLSYVPVAPMADPIAKSMCVPVPPAVRDVLWRVVADDSEAAGRLARALRAAGVDPVQAGAEEVAAALDGFARNGPGSGPTELALDLSEEVATDRVEALRAVVVRFAEQPGAACLTLRAAGCRGGAVSTIAGFARDLGLRVHVRTDLVCDARWVETLLEAGPDLISIDLGAEDEATYLRATGRDSAAFATSRRNMDRLLGVKTGQDRWAPRLPMIVPRITRCDAVYEQIEGFYDRWIMTCGCAVIDPAASVTEGERIAPLPLPAQAARRRALSVMQVDGDCVVRHEGREVGDVLRQPLTEVWLRLWAARFGSVQPRGAKNQSVSWPAA